MAISLIEVVRQGGCYWIKQPNSPGHSLAIPNKTSFRVALEGPKSHRFIRGECQNGYYVIEDGRRFTSANETVNAVREPSSNAFLHIDFLVDGQWKRADTLRTDERFSCDEIDEEALKQARGDVERYLKKKGRTMGVVEVTCKAAELVAKQPERRERAAKWLQDVASFDVTDLLRTPEAQ